MNNPESITVDLETAEKLREAGWGITHTHWHWVNGELLCYERCQGMKLLDGDIILPAPTCEEILRELPDYLDTEYVLLAVRDHPETKWSVNYIQISEDGVKYHPDHEFRARPIQADTLASASALMWIFLKENNLLTPTHE